VIEYLLRFREKSGRRVTDGQPPATPNEKLATPMALDICRIALDVDKERFTIPDIRVVMQNSPKIGW
jgi:hypothetical protein